MLSFGLTTEQQIFALTIIFYLFKSRYMTSIDNKIGNIFTFLKFCILMVFVVVDIWFFLLYLTLMIS